MLRRSAARLRSAGKLSSRRWYSALGHTPPTKVTTLGNGIRVASEAGLGESATVGVWVDTGSVFENGKNNGVAHFLEHMIFKGTSTRSRRALEVEVENMGAKLNAYTSREQTVYYANVFRSDVGKGVAILGDILRNSKLDAQDIEAERGVILREMEEVESQPEEVVFDHLHSVAFQDTPLGYTILGPRENIKSISRNDIVDYVNTHYTGNRIVVSAAGGVDHDELVATVQQHLGDLPAGPAPGALARPAVPFTGSMVVVREDNLPLVHATYAAEGVGWTDPDYYPLVVLQTIIGTWDRTQGIGGNAVPRLGEIFGTEGNGHSLMAFNTTYNDTGLFGVYATAPAEHIEDVSCEVLSEWARLGKEASDKEVDRAKRKLKANLLMGLDSTFSVAEEIGRQLLTLGRRMPPQELFARIDEVDAATIRKVASNRLNDVDIAVAAYGPTETFPDYNHLRGWTYRNRL